MAFPESFKGQTSGTGAAYKKQKPKRVASNADGKSHRAQTYKVANKYGNGYRNVRSVPTSGGPM